MIKKSKFKWLLFVAIFELTVFSVSAQSQPVDYVNPYIGNISHLLVPTYPTVHLPNSMLRIYPQRDDFASDLILGLPVALTSHRGSFAFNISPVQDKNSGLARVENYSYDKEKLVPYRFQTYLDEVKIAVDFAPSHQSGVYSIHFDKQGINQLVLNTDNGNLKVEPDGISGFQIIEDSPAKIYIFLETAQKVATVGKLTNGRVAAIESNSNEQNQTLVLNFGKENTINLRYGISFISVEQAKKNLHRELKTYDVDEVAKVGREIWNQTLGKIEVDGGSDNDKTVFYTALYRTYERMINISEDARYYSPFDNKIHDDGGNTAYTDDWIWDTYRAVHPLRILIEPELEKNIIHSYIRMAQESPEGWLPTFPTIKGDMHCMNGNHGVAFILDAYQKGIRDFDLKAAYKAAKGALTEKSLIPWVRIPNTSLDTFYVNKGYYPALKEGETETVKQVTWENRQPVPVTLGKSFDDWALSQIAKIINKKEDYVYFLKSSYNYRNIFNPKTSFFHPKDANGNFIEPFDYRFSGGVGARAYYDENNGWTYRWDVQHNVADLVKLMGGAEKFSANLDATFREPMGAGKREFYWQLPDQTGNVGQFTMANEPSLHIPYLYNYAGQPWKTQKRIRQLLKEWFRNDLMGVPGDEDGGGMSGFVVFSSIGFYPVTPGSGAYNIGSPLFTSVKMKLGNGKFFEIVAKNSSDQNKYIQSATLNGKTWNKPWFSHTDIANGGKLELILGNEPNYNWGNDLKDTPPSATPID